MCLVFFAYLGFVASYLKRDPIAFVLLVGIGIVILIYVYPSVATETKSEPRKKGKKSHRARRSQHR
jgi:threonine/homoserine/homoserine lactone efflux protein